MEQNNSIPIPVLPGMRGDLEPHTAPIGTIALARNVRFPSPGVVQPRRGLRAISADATADVEYTDVLDATVGPDFLHPLPGGFVFGAGGFGFRYDADAADCHIAGSYSIAQPRGKLDVSAREELTPIDNTILTPWPLSCAAKDGLIATCHSVGEGQPAAGIAVVGTQRDVVDTTATAGALIRVFTESGSIITSWYDIDMVSAAVVENHDPGTVSPIAIVYQDSSSTDIRVMLISASGAIGASTSIGTLSTVASFWAVCNWPGIGWALAYQSAADTLTIKKMAGVTVSATQTQTITSGAGAPVSVYADATNLFLGWAIRGGASYDAQFRPFDAALTAVAALQTVQVMGSADADLGPPLFGPCVTSSTVLALVGRCSSGRPDAGSTFTTVYRLTIGGVVTAGAVCETILPLSAPFNNGMWWARLATRSPGSIQSQRAVLLDHQSDRTSASQASALLAFPKISLVCEAYAGFEGNTNIPANCYQQHLHTPVELSTGEWLMGIPRLVRVERIESGLTAYLPLAEFLLFAVGCEQQTKTVGKDVLVSGSLCSVSYSLGELTYYNGSQFFSQSYGLDIGFPCPPSIGLLGSSNASGALDNNGVYQYRAVSEYIDSYGRRWRSAPSDVSSITLGAADDTVTASVEAFHPIMRAFSSLPANTRINVHLYRTENGGDQFQRVTHPMGAPVPYVDGTGSWTDEESDEIGGEHEFIYTSGGATQNDMPPSCRYIAVTEDRVWLAGLWETGVAQSSKLFVPGQPIEFSDLDSFKVSIPDTITGIASQDGQVALFTVDSIYVVQGLGPNEQGQGAWDSPRCITRSSGCIDWRSIVETSVGVFYQSERGIMLLPRGAGEPMFIGAAVEDLLEEIGPNITGSSVCQTSDGVTVRFCTAGGTLVYDLETLAWSYDIPPSSPANTVHTKVCDSDAGPVYARKAATGSIAFDMEESDSYEDDGGTIRSYVEWCPVHPKPLASWTAFTGAVTVFGKLDGRDYPDSPVSVRCDVDNDTSNTRTLTDMTSMSAIDYRKCQLNNVRQGTAVTLSFETHAAPWRFIGWTLELEQQQGTRNIPNPENY